ncbi:heat shock protein Hsp-16.2-like [Pecten maximus]|uniref:heat shock protein Hsp-16.2-like n=1 Tax=Pecten maximus TaxID=6579 RepID=UPI0014584927|nr:heat shock protein Hsp-16.2-like [Pecten maximus]
MTTRAEDDKRVNYETTKNFTLSFNKDQFTGDDAKVLLKGNNLLVTSEKKERKDGVFRTEYNATQYTLPDDVDVRKLSCSKSSDGELSVTAPYKELDI